MKRFGVLATSILASCLASACVTGRVEDTMPSTLHANSPAAPARALVVLMPGAGDRIGKFDDRGFVDALRESGQDVDILEIDAHYGYYRSRTLLDRMHADVLAPNRDKYEAIWLVGLSMGGLGALLSAQTHPELVDGIVLIAPYMGRPKLVREIEAAGGLATWDAPAGPNPWDVEVWRTLDRAVAGDGPEIWLVYGADDFGARAHDLLAAALPKARVATVPGGHEWPVWTSLWAGLMKARPFDPIK